MEKFTKVLRGYNPVEVNKFIDEIIFKVESMMDEIKGKDNEINLIKEKLSHYNAIETTLNKAIFAAQEAGDQIKRVSRQEGNLIVEEAKKNANRIVNEALIRAERTEYETNLLKKNISVFKNRLRNIIEAQLEMVDDIDKTEI
ncbi:MAG: DivIVA domain-containing protein [Bacilli bacterium]